MDLRVFEIFSGVTPIAELSLIDKTASLACQAVLDMFHAEIHHPALCL
jgi:hypothetical protein